MLALKQQEGRAKGLPDSGKAVHNKNCNSIEEPNG